MTAVESTLKAWIIRFACAFAFLLPASAVAASVALALLILTCAMYKVHIKRFLRFSSPVMFFLLLFYFLHLAGLLYTSNFAYAGLDLQIKASFLLLPVFIDNLWLSATDFRKVTRAFITGCSLYALVLLLNASLEYIIWTDPASFFYIDFSGQKHVAYLTMYINCAILFLYDEFLRKPGYRFKNSIFIMTWILFLLVIVTLLSSRTALVTVFITFCGYIIFNEWKSGRKGIAAVKTISAAILMLLLYFGITGSRNRFEKPAAAVMSAEKYDPASATVTGNVRFNVWRYTMELYGRNPLFGTGTGDVKDELRNIYAEHRFYEGLDFNLSPHNQFLHTLAALGIPGILTLLLIFIYPMKLSLRHNDYLLLFFITAVLLNCLTEGILEKQDGVLFFVFFLTVITGSKKDQLVKSASI